MRKAESELLDISWDKVMLKLKISVKDDKPHDELKFYLLNKDETAVTEFQIAEEKNNTYTIVLNISNSGINRCVDNGMYHILATDDQSVYSYIEYTGNANYLTDKSRCLRTNSNHHAYTITFYIPETEEDPILMIHFQYMVNTGMSYIPELDGTSTENKSFLKRLISRIKKPVLRKLKKSKYSITRKAYSLFHKLFYKKDGRFILFLSDTSEVLSENLLCLHERMTARELDREYTIRFSLVNRADPLKNKFRRALKNLKKLYYISKANVLLLDDAIAFMNWVVLDPEQTIIQVWHSGAGFKCIGYARWGALNTPGAFVNHRQYTYFVSDSERLANEWALLAGILEEQVIPTGMPRIDKYLNQEHREKAVSDFYTKYPELKEKTVILFAPTYRGADQTKAYYPYDKIDFDALYDCCKKKNAAVLFKVHPFVKEPVPIRESQKDVFYDVFDQRSINDLFYITDLLITDYSSGMYEYSLMNKPMLAYAFDEIQYSSSHGFPRPYEENIPGRLCTTFDELLKAIENDDYQYEKHEAYINKYFDHIDTNNSDRVIDWLILGEMPEKYAVKLQNKLDRIKEVRGKSYAWLNPEQ